MAGATTVGLVLNWTVGSQVRQLSAVVPLAVAQEICFSAAVRASQRLVVAFNLKLALQLVHLVLSSIQFSQLSGQATAQVAVVPSEVNPPAVQAVPSVL